jgi:FkbM family methyltransferase
MSRGPLKRGLLATPLGTPLLGLKRRFDAPEVRRDREDNELLLVLLAEVLEPDSNCVEVGAHEGAILAEMVRLAPRGRHVAFEPLPALARSLAERFPTVDVRNTAVSDAAGEAGFVHVATRPGWSGFRQRPYPGDERIERITVRTERLDDVVGERVALIKIDVEGAELGVLEGARATLARDRPVVVFEHGLGSADHYGTTPRDLWRVLVDGAGLEIGGLDGDGPYTLERLERVYERRERVNFVARPTVR